MTQTRKTKQASEKTLEQRVDALEKLGRRLERTTTALKNTYGETKDRLDHIEQVVNDIPDQLAERVEKTVMRATDNQTKQLRVEMAESETRNADRVTNVARQWPAAAVVVATIAGGIVIDLILAAAHLPHIS